MLPVGKEKKIYFKSCHSYFLSVAILLLWCFFSFRNNKQIILKTGVILTSEHCSTYSIYIVPYTGLISQTKGDLKDGTATLKLKEQPAQCRPQVFIAQACKKIFPTCVCNYTKMSKSGLVAICRLMLLGLHFFPPYFTRKHHIADTQKKTLS